MRENRTQGSARGAPGNGRPYLNLSENLPMNTPNDLGSLQLRETELLRQIADLKREVAELKEELEPYRKEEKLLSDRGDAIVTWLSGAEGVFTRPSIATLATELGFYYPQILIDIFRLDEARLVHADYNLAKVAEFADTIPLSKR